MGGRNRGRPTPRNQARHPCSSRKSKVISECLSGRGARRCASVLSGQDNGQSPPPARPDWHCMRCSASREYLTRRRPTDSACQGRREGGGRPASKHSGRRDPQNFDVPKHFAAVIGNLQYGIAPEALPFTALLFAIPVLLKFEGAPLSKQTAFPCFPAPGHL